MLHIFDSGLYDCDKRNIISIICINLSVDMFLFVVIALKLNKLLFRLLVSCHNRFMSVDSRLPSQKLLLICHCIFRTLLQVAS
jgi:membrane-anchored protein YejM (alkaline phosphatase superfamily)